MYFILFVVGMQQQFLKSQSAYLTYFFKMTTCKTKIVSSLILACLFVVQAVIAAPLASLSLLGTSIQSSGRNSAIIMDESSGKQQLVYAGDTIQTAVIQKVERGRVFLTVNGQQEILTQENRKGGGSGADMGANILPDNVMPPPPPPAPAPVPAR